MIEGDILLKSFCAALKVITRRLKAIYTMAVDLAASAVPK